MASLYEEVMVRFGFYIMVLLKFFKEILLRNILKTKTMDAYRGREAWKIIYYHFY